RPDQSAGEGFRDQLSDPRCALLGFARWPVGHCFCPGVDMGDEGGRFRVEGGSRAGIGGAPRPQGSRQTNRGAVRGGGLGRGGGRAGRGGGRGRARGASWEASGGGRLGPVGPACPAARALTGRRGLSSAARPRPRPPVISPASPPPTLPSHPASNPVATAPSR